jgi:heme exporter protein D
MAEPNRRTLAMGLAACCVLLALAAAVIPLVLNAAYNESLLARRELVTTQERLARAAGGQATTSGIEILLAGNTPGSIAADLQRRMMTLAVKTGASVRSLQIDLAPVDQSLLPATADIALQASTDMLQALIHAIEAGAPLLFVEDVTIQRSAAEPVAGGPRRAAMLDVTLKVKGFGAALAGGGKVDGQ